MKRRKKGKPAPPQPGLSTHLQRQVGFGMDGPDIGDRCMNRWHRSAARRAKYDECPECGTKHVENPGSL